MKPTTETCLQCGCTFTAARTGRRSRVCGKTCRDARNLAIKRGDGDADMGPAIPLDGLTDAARQRQRDARIVRAITEEGLDVHALCERFRLSEKALTELLQRTGAPRPSRYEWPLGLPA